MVDYASKLKTHADAVQEEKNQMATALQSVERMLDTESRGHRSIQAQFRVRSFSAGHFMSRNYTVHFNIRVKTLIAPAVMGDVLWRIEI